MIGVVTASVGTLCLIGAFLIATVGRMQWPRFTVALVLTGVTGILNSTVGGWVHAWVTQADRWSAQAIGRWTGTAVFGTIGLVAFCVAAFRIWHNQIDNHTLAWTAAVPPTVTLIPGTLGTVAATVVGIVPAAFGYLFALAFGIR